MEWRSYLNRLHALLLEEEEVVVEVDVGVQLHRLGVKLAEENAKEAVVGDAAVVVVGAAVEVIITVVVAADGVIMVVFGEAVLQQLAVAIGERMTIRDCNILVAPKCRFKKTLLVLRCYSTIPLDNCE